ncbi:unnamed protein product [Closterium sp. NIES-65]|nr:unnamed protein product [Closterium sp. NIES-65]
MFKYLKQLWRQGQAAGAALDKRRLQQHADTHRLLLLAWLREQGGSASEAAASRFAQEVAALPLEESRRELAGMMRAQMRQTLQAMQAVFEPASACGSGSGSASGTGQESGQEPFVSELSFALGQTLEGRKRPSNTAHPSHLSPSEASSAFYRSTGFSLSLRPSSVPHPTSGLGLFLHGSASPGTIVAQYPGVIYPRVMHRYLPGFPLVDSNNPYLLARFDGVIVDARPWGVGGAGREMWSGIDEENLAWLRERERWEREEGLQRIDDPWLKGRGARDEERALADAVSGSTTGPSASSTSSSVVGDCDDASSGSNGSSGSNSSSSSSTSMFSFNRALEAALARVLVGGDSWRNNAALLTAAIAATQVEIERRNPLALAHFANHPGGSGQSPNVAICPLDIPLEDTEWNNLRPYMPNSVFRLMEKRSEGMRRGRRSAGRRGSERDSVETSMEVDGDDEDEEMKGGVLRTVVLVATDVIKDEEEVFLDYRLNPNANRPDWYVPVDAKAEERRWS